MIYAKPSTALVVVFRAYLASDHVTPATGKTIAITISKNGGAFGNPNAGATNATEISSGFYKVTLDTTDTGTAGPLLVRGAEAAIDDVGVAYYVGQSPADVTHWIGTAAATPTTAGVPEVDVTHWLGTAAATPTVAGVPEVDVTHIGGTAATAAAGIPEVKVASLANNAITAAAIAAAAIDAATFAADTDVYTAKGWLQRKSTATATDEYSCLWLKNGVEVTSGITTPLIQVIKRSDGTDLIASTAMTEIGATGLLKYDSTAALQTAGTSYFVKFTATIDGSARTYTWPQGRDV